MNYTHLTPQREWEIRDVTTRVVVCSPLAGPRYTNCIVVRHVADWDWHRCPKNWIAVAK